MANRICTWLSSLTLKKIWKFSLYLFRYITFFQIPLILPLFLELFLLTGVAYMAIINKWQFAWSASAGFLISLLMDSVSEVLGYFQANYILDKEFTTATFFSNRLVAAIIAIGIATWINLAHVTHQDDWITFIQELFIPFLCVLPFFYWTLRKYHQKKAEYEAATQLETVLSLKDEIALKTYKVLVPNVDKDEKARRHRMKLRAFFINLVTMFVNGFVGGLTKDLQSTLVMDRTRDNNTIYVSYASVFSNFLVLGVGTLLGYLIVSPEPKTFREQRFIILVRIGSGIVGFTSGLNLGCEATAWIPNEAIASFVLQIVSIWKMIKTYLVLFIHPLV